MSYNLRSWPIPDGHYFLNSLLRNMSKRNFVCFDCRAAVRRELYSGEAVLCSDCGLECHNIGYKVPVPPKSKPEAWKSLREQYFRDRRQENERKAVKNIRRRHALEKEIQDLEVRPENEGRTKEIRRIRRQLDSL